MDQQVLGGGVIVLVAVVLWLVYLVPSWHARHQFNAAERNAVRLNQALRVLAETSETPNEVHLELSARTALQQQKLARRLQAQQEEAELEELRQSVEAARQTPAARRARARRRARLISTGVLIAGLGAVGWGVWQTVAVGSQVWLWTGVGVSGVAVVLLQRMASVQARQARRAADARVQPVVAERALPALQDIQVAAEGTTWTPRELPRPLVASGGSRASAELDAAEARESLRRAEREAALAKRIEQMRPAPTPITAARQRDDERSASASGASPFREMGVIDDAEIEAHVRQLLAQRRAVGA